MTNTMLALALSLSFTSLACKQQQADKADKADKTGAAPAPAPAPAPTEADKPAAPRAMSATELFADYNKPGQDALALIDKWRPGVIVSGTVERTVSEESGLEHVWLDGGGGAHVTLDFTDQGAAAKQKGVKAGDKVTAQCAVGGSDAKLMMLTDCVMK